MQQQSPNAEQIAYWNDSAGPQWVRHQERLDRTFAPLSDQAISALRLSGEEVVLDIGCGCGATTIALASSARSVMAIDISEPMLGRARERAQTHSNAQFVLADAMAHQFDTTFDVLFSRFGVMFFDDPVVAFKNLRSALKPLGRLNLLVWQSAANNPWIAEPMRAAQQHLPKSTDAPNPSAEPKYEQGPFAFGDEAFAQSIFADAGFVDVRFEACRAEVTMGATVDDAMVFYKDIGPLKRMLDEQPPQIASRALEAVESALHSHRQSDGSVVLGASCWLIQGHNPH